MEVRKAADFTREEERKIVAAGGKVERYTVRGEKWVYIIHPMYAKREE